VLPSKEIVEDPPIHLGLGSYPSPGTWLFYLAGNPTERVSLRWQRACLSRMNIELSSLGLNKKRKIHPTAHSPRRDRRRTERRQDYIASIKKTKNPAAPRTQPSIRRSNDHPWDSHVREWIELSPHRSSSLEVLQA